MSRIDSIVIRIDSDLDSNARVMLLEEAMTEDRNRRFDAEESPGRVGSMEFPALTQRDVRERQAQCDGKECFFAPGCRPGECPADRGYHQ